MRNMSYDSPNIGRYWVRFFFDVSFFALITVIFLNIIFGIIVDTFAELRDAKTAMEEDMNNKCFICAIDRSVFEKNSEVGGGFESHIENEH
jgi:hypothetical protein